MNEIRIKGRLTAEPKVGAVNGSEYTQFSVAVNRRFNREATDFFECTAWNKTAELIKKYFKKGQEILLGGEMQCSQYTNKDGDHVRAWRIAVEWVEFCGAKGSEGRDSSAAPQNDNRAQNGMEAKGADEVFVPVEGIDDDDLPF